MFDESCGADTFPDDAAEALMRFACTVPAAQAAFRLGGLPALRAYQESLK